MKKTSVHGEHVMRSCDSHSLVCASLFLMFTPAHHLWQIVIFMHTPANLLVCDCVPCFDWTLVYTKCKTTWNVPTILHTATSEQQMSECAREKQQIPILLCYGIIFGGCSYQTVLLFVSVVLGMVVCCFLLRLVQPRSCCQRCRCRRLCFFSLQSFRFVNSTQIFSRCSLLLPLL